MKHVALASVLLVSLPLLAGCGGGGGGGPEAVTVDGWWEYLVRAPGAGGDFEQQLILPLRQTGSQVVLYDVTLSRDGAILTGAYPDYETAQREEFTFTIRSEALIEGRILSTLAGPEPVTSDALLRRVPTPDGDLTVNGRAWNGPLNLNTSTAYAVRAALGGASDGVRYLILDVAGEGHAELSFNQPRWSVTDTYDMASQQGRFTYHEVTDSAAEGVLTRLDAPSGRLRGTFSMTTADGRTLGGHFDVPILMEL